MNYLFLKINLKYLVCKKPKNVTKIKIVYQIVKKLILNVKINYQKKIFLHKKIIENTTDYLIHKLIREKEGIDLITKKINMLSE